MYVCMYVHAYACVLLMYAHLYILCIVYVCAKMLKLRYVSVCIYIEAYKYRWVEVYVYMICKSTHIHVYSEVYVHIYMQGSWTRRCGNVSG